jgi:Ice-binding-like
MKSLSFSIHPFLTAVMLLFFPNISFGQAPDLRTVYNFVFFSTVGAVGSTGISQVIGDVGTNCGAITGFDTVNNEVYNADAVTAQGSIDLLVASNQLDSTVSTSSLTSLLGNGQILTPGVYIISEASSLNGDLFLDAEGDANAVFIFKITGAFTTTTSAKVYLVNGALAINVFWKAIGAISMAAGSDMKGTFIANDGAFSMAAGSRLEGRGLSTTGAISVDGVVAYRPDVALPVTLIDFKATKADPGIELFWTVADEYSLARYELGRSADGLHFYTIGSVNSANTAFLKSYNWPDNTPLAGTNFYRLKMVDMDGVFKYSSVIKINTDVKKSISVYCNPVTNHMLVLKLYGQLKGDHIINLYTSSGIQVMSTRMAYNSHDVVSSISLDKNLAKGVYFLKISDPGKNETTLKILID